ncbi:MAG TPA: hypothetical protein VL172_11730 [Kofleriaceae bacterium]|nr:hypothetical protein [Kofleriaceae bacterium]
MRWALLLVVLAGCPGKTVESRKLDPDRFVIDFDKLTLRTDVVGEAEFAAPATFVLIDVTNEAGVDADVDLGGDLIDKSGQILAPLKVASLRIPAGQKRTFALVDDAHQARPDATGAAVRIAVAHEATHPLPLSVERGTVHHNGDRLLASAIIRNLAERTAKVIVLGTFYDAQDRPLTRPFTVLQLDGKTSHPVEFSGPPGATKGYIFIGDSVW